MNILKKRIIPGIMAGVLAVSMVIPAFADTTITGTYTAPKIDVTVPQTGTVHINPYGMPVKVDATNKIVGEQISTIPMFMTNEGDTPLTVSASVTATAKGDLKFATTAPAAGDTSKSAYVYLQMKQAETVKDATTDADKANKEFVAWKQAYTEGKDILLNGTKAAEGKDLVYLAGSKITAGTKGDGSDDTVTHQTGSTAMIRLAGKVVEDPKEAWTDKDGFSAVIAFTFKPVNTTATITQADSKTSVEEDSTLTFSVKLPDESITAEEWTWDVTDGTILTKGTPANAATFTVTGKKAGSTTVTVEVLASNGITYTGEYAVTVTAK